jgi:Protein of unknown function (DUF2510)
MKTRVVPDGKVIEGRRSGDWYPNPAERAQYRYFDGVRWTEHIETDGVATVDPVPLVGEPPSSRRWPG